MHKVLLVLVVIVGVSLWAEPALAQEANTGAAAGGMHISLSQTITVIVYLMILGYLGYLGYRRSKTAAEGVSARRAGEALQVLAPTHFPQMLDTGLVAAEQGHELRDVHNRRDGILPLILRHHAPPHEKA